MHRFAFVLLAGLLLGGAAEAQIALRQSDAVEIIIGPLVDATDGVTAETELTISQGDVLLIKCAAAGDCGSSAQKNDSNACTHVAGGRYKCDLDTTDTNTVGVLHVTVSESGAAPWFASYVVVEEAVYDACCAASAAPLNAAGVRQAVGLASANLDTQLQTIDTNVDNIETLVTTIEGQTDDIGVAGAGLTAIPWNPAWDAEVQSEVADALNAEDGANFTAIPSVPVSSYTNADGDVCVFVISEQEPHIDVTCTEAE